MEQGKGVEYLPLPTRILVADADRNDRQGVCNALEDAGYSVVLDVEGGDEAIAATQRLRPDLVIADVALQCVDGIAVAEILFHEKIAPVVLLTGHIDGGLIHRAAIAGVQSYLTKPMRPAALVAGIEVTRAHWQRLREQERKIAQIQNKETARAVVDRAKRILMASGKMNECEAYRFIQIRSMNSRRTMRQVAEAMLLCYEGGHLSVPRQGVAVAVGQEVV